ncbi:leucine-rich repeat-containing protein 24 [Drosophila novamexicana]|uniref:leucine-rich repeat-containing protein 24 n=1 Tax=Drosophila novamexicana TaxID=47314 RepID=UPI0011E5DE76|nr:leucine-rich repeat-containing protein 24 [Drosophila novamexicana]
MALQCVIQPKMWLGLKQILLYVGLLLCVVLQVCRSKTQLQLNCPSVCHCDLYAERNRAICSAKRLISASLDMPKTVELLDLSYNDITTIDDDCFESTVHLVNLTLAHNAIHTLHVNAFGELRRLRSLDLSYNRLEQIDEHLLETNSQLMHVSLAGNKLATLGDFPLLRSTSLRTLNLRNAQINQLGPESLSALPQLRQLDLAQNMLLTLNINVFHAPRYLASVNLDENPLNCDRALIKVATWLSLRGVTVSMTDCLEERLPSHPLDVQVDGAFEEPPKLERMENLESGSSSSDGPKSVVAVWRELPDDSEEQQQEQEPEEELSTLIDVCEGNREQLCLRYRNCLERVSHELLAGSAAQPPDQVKSTHIFDEDDVKLAFAVGGATGICMVIFIISFALCIKSGCELRRKRRQPADGETTTLDSSQQQLPTIHTWTPSTIRNPRRSNPQRSRNAPSRALVRQPYGPDDNFVSRLFGRPARRQYYRSINQNTATLIRRLSRSNLFSTRDREPSSPETPPAATARFYTDIVEAGAVRPETPPPNYGDVVVIDNCDNK